MKKFFVLLAFLSTGFLLSCRKDKALPTVEAVNLSVEEATVILSGDLAFPSKTNTGSAKVYQRKDGKFILGLEKMNLNTGTFLVIYLSPLKAVSTSSIKIFSVTNLNGAVFHVLPTHIDFALFKHLIIQTEPSEEVIASAELH